MNPDRIGAPRRYHSRECRGRASTNKPRRAMDRVAAECELVAQLLADHPDLKQREIGERLGMAQQTVSRRVAKLVKAGRIERTSPEEARREALRASNEARTVRAVAELGTPGGCGCWRCRDLECQNPPGQCHHCDRPAQIAPFTDRRRRWVAGEPTLCCSEHGPMWLTVALREGRARGLRTEREAAEWLGVAGITYYLREELLKPDEVGPGRLMWFSEPTLKACQSALARERAPQLDSRLTAEGWYDERWFDRLVERHGAKEARRRRAEALARIERRRKQRARHHAGASRRDDLRDALRAILQRLDSQYQRLGTWGYNEILAAVGEQAWADRLGNFRDEYPADRWGDFDPAYRKNVISRVARLIGEDIKALQIAATKSAA